MKKRCLSIILALAVILSSITCLSSITAFATDEITESIYVVSGNDPDVFGLIWYQYPTDNNTMKKSGDYYTFTIEDVEPNNNLEFNIVENKPDGTQNVYGHHYSIFERARIEFRVIETTDVIIYFHPTTHEIDVYGDGVKLVTGVTRVYAVSQNSDALGGMYPHNNPYPYSGEMTLGEDGVYTVTFKDVEPEEDIKIDIVDEHLGGFTGFYGFNYCPIDVVKKCDVTVHYIPGLEEAKIWATGDGVVIRNKPVIDKLFIRGDWTDFDYSEDNKMTQVDDYVYQLKVENMTNDEEHNFIFLNRQDDFLDFWCNYFEYEAEVGVEHEAFGYPIDYGFMMIPFKAPYKHSNVTFTLDLTDYDYVTKLGAKFRIDATDMRGDINGDGEVTIQDVTELQKSLAEMTFLNDNQNISSDVNEDGFATITDATLMQKYIADYYDSFDDISVAE